MCIQGDTTLIVIVVELINSDDDVAAASHATVVGRQSDFRFASWTGNFHTNGDSLPVSSNGTSIGSVGANSVAGVYRDTAGVSAGLCVGSPRG